MNSELRCFTCDRCKSSSITKVNGQNVCHFCYEKSQGCYICDVPDASNHTVLDNYPEYQYSETKDGVPFKQKYKFCPNCGAKIKKGDKK